MHCEYSRATKTTRVLIVYARSFHRCGLRNAGCSANFDIAECLAEVSFEAFQGGGVVPRRLALAPRSIGGAIKSLATCRCGVGLIGGC